MSIYEKKCAAYSNFHFDYFSPFPDKCVDKSPIPARRCNSFYFFCRTYEGEHGVSALH